MGDKSYTFRYPTVLSIAGSDSSGGAGIQADLKTISALGGYGCTAITAITAQNTLGVSGIWPLSQEALNAQMDAVFSDLHVDAVKTGMLHNAETVRCVAEAMKRYKVKNLVVDPVLVATSGDALSKGGIVEAMRESLFPLAKLITPNLKEAEILSGQQIQTLEDMKQVAGMLLQVSLQGVLIKGGHLTGVKMIDVLLTAGMKEPLLLESDRIETDNLHGTGCTLSSAIATFLARGFSLEEAVVEAKEYVWQAIRSGAEVFTGEGHGPLNHAWQPVRQQIIELKE
ncbi:MAG: bifunctional hydroxymethylpyrimidine kinase/phosphomethylpyrimidine kinase [Bacteroidales bacterium]|nr:bifunctional hydroxymethylpyrimidine kinase/phosphomethylpyrimidine kinase [Bacteroidales bacterium]MDD4820963.1 bifunctional hydroxymethylpyrimidine kinase/phosphomethylpyrimidine kinase [Bacteroidales bacterium]